MRAGAPVGRGLSGPCAAVSQSAAAGVPGLAGKAALVVGASSGIGQAIAGKLAECSVAVTLVARRRSRLDDVAARIHDAGGAALAEVGDVRSEADVERVFSQHCLHWGRLDIVVNSAGAGYPAPISTGPLDHWREMLEVNVLSVALLVREAMRHFDTDIGGHILTVSSTSAHRVLPRNGFYTATKFAARALVEAARQEIAIMAVPIRVSAVSPGRVATEFFGGGPDLGDATAELSPEDVAQVVIQTLAAPPALAVNDVVIRATGQVT